MKARGPGLEEQWRIILFGFVMSGIPLLTMYGAGRAGAAFAMVQLGILFEDMDTALDLEEGLALLNRRLGTRKSVGRDSG